MPKIKKPRKKTIADYYSRLGLQVGASKREVTRAYRKIALEHHPDRFPKDMNDDEKLKHLEIFLKATEATEIIRGKYPLK